MTANGALVYHGVIASIMGVSVFVATRHVSESRREWADMQREARKKYAEADAKFNKKQAEKSLKKDIFSVLFTP